MIKSFHCIEVENLSHKRNHFPEILSLIHIAAYVRNWDDSARNKRNHVSLLEHFRNHLIINRNETKHFHFDIT